MCFFTSRLDPNVTVDNMNDYLSEMFGNEATVQKLESRLPYLSSFVVTCDFNHKDALLNPEIWESGILVRNFFGKVPELSQSL